MTSTDFKNALKNGNTTLIRTYPNGEKVEVEIIRAGKKIVTLYRKDLDVKYQEFFSPTCDYSNRHGLNFKDNYKIKTK